MAVDVPPHEALLWACTTLWEEGEVREALQLTLAAPVDWPACARMSIRHGLASIAAHHLSPFAGDPRYPDDVAACFERMLLANGCRNAVLFRECSRLLHGLHEAGIRCLVLKGVGLALTVYSDPALRNFADIDLLVDPADLDRAGMIAQTLGFAPQHAEADNCVLHRTFVGCCPEDILTDTLPLEYEPDLPRAKVVDNRHKVVVEIHQGLFRNAAGMIRHVDNDPLWCAPRRACLPDGTSILLPSREVSLVHLAAHAADHGFARLMYFYDIAATVCYSRETIDWDLVVDLAGRYEVGDYVYRCLEFVRRECGAPVPPCVLTALAQDGRKRVPPLQRADIFGAERELSTGIVLQRLRLEPDWRHFCLALRSILFPPPVIMRRIYGAQHPMHVALLYMLRPILLAGHLARTFLQRR